MIEKGYEVYGIARRHADGSLGMLDLLPKDKRNGIHILFGDVTDAHFVADVISKLKPYEVYHLAAQSLVPYSFENPMYTYDINIGGTLNVINAIKDYSSSSRMYNAATSEIYGQPEQTPQNENTPFKPRSPYAVSKLAAFWSVKIYREAYGLFMSNGILFNHESEVRGGPMFVTRKITLGVAKIYCGSSDPIVLGNLNARKDWGYARDYVEGCDDA